mgnify:CR=1 FL=1
MEFDKERNNDKEYVLEQVRKQGSLLDLASDELKDDKEVWRHVGSISKSDLEKEIEKYEAN